VLRQNTGDKVTVIGAGVTLHEALKAAETLKPEGIGITVIDATASSRWAGGHQICRAKNEPYRYHRRRPLP